MAFSPQSIHWKSKHGILLVHGIGNASEGADGSFPLDALRDSLGDDAAGTAIYRLNYDFINDWAATKVDFGAALLALKQSVGQKLGGDMSADIVADYIGDVLWPVLSANIRFAVRDAFVAQLAQIHVDRCNAALARGDDPLDYSISIVAHSLGCFHAYEGLWATSTEPSHQLTPRSDLFTLQSVVLMASPVQLIRSVAGAIRALVPDVDSLTCISQPLAIPAETHRGKRTPCTPRFVAVTGSQDPVGGHVLGHKQDWAFMNVPGQETIIDGQRLTTVSSRAELASALLAVKSGAAPPISDPHSWTAYIARHADLLRGASL